MANKDDVKEVLGREVAIDNDRQEGKPSSDTDKSDDKNS